MSTAEIILKPRKGLSLVDLKEIWSGKELLLFLVWRDIKIRYRQTILGGLWAVLQPLSAMLIFTFFFHNWAGIDSGGSPYPLFAYAGLTAWTFFASAVTAGSNSLVLNQQMISKIYFPRIFIPLGAIAALLVDLFLSLLLMAGLMIHYHWKPSPALIYLPFFIVLAFLSATGISLGLSALNVRYRDIKYAVPFLVQMGLFVTPVIYPLKYLPAKAQHFMVLNPMAAVVEGFHFSLLGTRPDWNLILGSTITNLIILIIGMLLFDRMQRFFADII